LGLCCHYEGVDYVVDIQVTGVGGGPAGNFKYWCSVFVIFAEEQYFSFHFELVIYFSPVGLNLIILGEVVLAVQGELRLQ